MFRHIPNLLTGLRLLLAVVFFCMLAYYQYEGRGDPTFLWVAFIVYLVALITDFLDGFLARRRELVARYEQLLADLPLTLPSLQAEAESAWHLYVVRVQTSRITLSHRQVFEGLRAAGIGVNVHYIPVHLQPYYRDLGFAQGDFPQAEAYYAEAISLPMYPLMTDKQQNQVVEQLRRLLVDAVDH